MHPADSARTEMELKLALPGADARRIAAQLAAVPGLAAVAATELRLHNQYLDTPAQDLRRAQAALRLRAIRQKGARVRWVQTFKTAGNGGAGLSRRGEWEVPLRSGRIDAAALQATPWPTLDKEGRWLAQLAPCFETDGVRTLRQVTAEDGSEIELVLDVGRVRTADGRSEDVVELELELVEGTPDALFTLAARLADHLPVLPATRSKAERGWRLVDGTSQAPRRARKLALKPRTPVLAAAQVVLGDALGQFAENLVGILHSDGSELVHQARAGWRRWRSALWLFKPLLAAHPPPDTAPLQPMLKALAATRDLDVAALESLPPWSEVFIADDEERAVQWQTMEAAVMAERRIRRAALLSTLQALATGQTLIALERWLHALPQAAASLDDAEKPVGAWTDARTRRLHERLERRSAALEPDDGIEHRHRVRLLAKRTRYVAEALRGVLPKARARRWQDEAAELQARMGAARDLALMARLLDPLGVDPAVLGFLRGVAAGRLAPG